MQQIATMLAALVLLASPAMAQKVDRNGIPYRAWDVDAGVGFHSLTGSDGGVGDQEQRYDYDDWSPSWVASLGAGYFVTSHFKLEAGTTFLQRYYTTTSEQVILPTGQVANTYASHEIRQTQLTFAATYQFLENTFAHPYVSGGVRVGLLDIESQRGPYASVVTNNSYRGVVIDIVERHSRELRARPYVAIGSKSYFSERTFVRPEMVLAFNRHGTSQFGARLAFGIDF
ncbi:MAG TPA: outer membrane beta-barrel protein [Vicinamibacterales bacterium]|nr:outer membrane beta-barrel protein [Vicinamibacterales bacterium]